MPNVPMYNDPGEELLIFMGEVDEYIAGIRYHMSMIPGSVKDKIDRDLGLPFDPTFKIESFQAIKKEVLDSLETVRQRIVITVAKLVQ